ncbi:endonuclease/exonuclease/phosphatase family protein [Actinoplanes sp. NPDC049599]|uniref:endonuclease/exonuclease/phosphatase family protein n=1 Tax=Actinoplanes sp. NPDC049599 TaxID=3363903 RepID=UPI00379810CF
MTEVRLLTFNTLMRGDVRRRLHALGALLRQSEYDIVCLQEVAFRRHADLLRRAAGRYGHHAWSGAVLLRGGLVLLSRWPVRGARFTRYPRLGPVRAEYLMRKGAQLAVVETPDGPLVVANTHLTANHDNDWSPRNRYTPIARAELGHLAAALAAADPALPAVVVGDLNVPRDSVALAGFLATTGLTDVLAGDPEPTFRPTARWPDPPAFDHVLVRPAPGRPLPARAWPVFPDAVPLPGGRTGYLSDHYGVAAALG